MTVFVLLIFALVTGLTYVVILLSARFLRLFKKADHTNNKKYSLISLITSFVVAGLITYFFLFTSPVTNYQTAYIKQEQKGYKLTLRGKRLYMVHDPVSIFLRQTYEDSVEYILPRNEGVIRGQELPTVKGHYQSNGNITINEKQLKIDLYADNYDDHTLDPSIWNGTYNLVRR